MDESVEIEHLMATAQGHDGEDETKRVQASRYVPVSKPASRNLFGIAKARGARIVFASDGERE